MTTATREFVIHRILVALDASPNSLAALQVASALAAAMNAELNGLFIEDATLLRFSQAPFARHVYPSGQEALDTLLMERHLRVQAERARQALAAAAERAQVRWSFRVARGEVAAEVLAAASDADLLTVGRGGWFAAQRLRLGSTALRVCQSAPGALLLVEDGVAFAPQAIVLYEGSSSSQRALAVAEQLASTYCQALIVLLPAGTAQAGKAMETEAAARLESPGEAQFRQLKSGDVFSIAHAVQAEGGGIVVIGDHSAAERKRSMQQLIRHVHCPILLVS